MFTPLTRLGHRLVAGQGRAVVNLALKLSPVVIGRVQRLLRPHSHQVGPALGDPGIPRELIVNRLA
ncbi:hypothetical protein D3C72_1356760 [compost metagenome]